MQTGAIIVNDLSNFISTVGFPIVVSVAMFYQNGVLASNYQQMTKELQDKIESNTLIMQRLIDKLDHDELLKDGAKNGNSNNQ